MQLSLQKEDADMKYDKVVAINKEKSRQKAQVAKKEIQTMLENGERITVEELRERTGFARSFFYRNPEVQTEKNDLYKTGMRCKGRVFRDTGQGAKIMVVIIGLVIIFKKQLNELVTKIFEKITNESSGI